MKKVKLFTVIGVLSAILLAQSYGEGKIKQEHQPLLWKNEFKKPEEVVQYYVARDASGFVWSGLLDLERRAFTTWKSVPEMDTFYIAKRYEILPVKDASPKGSARVEVRYDLAGIGDGHGTRVPAGKNTHSVIFDLKKVQGKWKIVKPEPPDVAPVVMESKFHF